MAGSAYGSTSGVSATLDRTDVGRSGRRACAGSGDKAAEGHQRCVRGDRGCGVRAGRRCARCGRGPGAQLPRGLGVRERGGRDPSHRAGRGSVHGARAGSSLAGRNDRMAADADLFVCDAQLRCSSSRPNVVVVPPRRAPVPVAGLCSSRPRAGHPQLRSSKLGSLPHRLVARGLPWLGATPRLAVADPRGCDRADWCHRRDGTSRPGRQRRSGRLAGSRGTSWFERRNRSDGSGGPDRPGRAGRSDWRNRRDGCHRCDR
jgi:hypothetical protein